MRKKEELPTVGSLSQLVAVVDEKALPNLLFAVEQANILRVKQLFEAIAHIPLIKYIEHV